MVVVDNRRIAGRSRDDWPPLLGDGCAPQILRPVRTLRGCDEFHAVRARLPYLAWTKNSEQSVNNVLPNTGENRVRGMRQTIEEPTG
jgi:hypothetical protein